MADRHDHQKFKEFTGELSTAIPIKLHTKPALLILLETLEPVNLTILIHEILHWCVKLEGYKTWQFKPNLNNNLQIHLNSLLQHPRVYFLQSSFGQTPLFEVESRMKHNLKRMKTLPEPIGDWLIEESLVLSDDLINCSSSLSTNLITTLQTFWPEAYKIVKKILKISKDYDLLDTHENQNFCKKVIKRLKLNPTNWEKLDEINTLKSF